MSSLTWRINAESEVLPGCHHTRTGMPSRVTAIGDHDLRQVISGVLGLAVGAEPDTVAAFGILGCRGRVAAPVADHRRIGVLDLEIRAGGIEKKQVNLEIKQVGDLMVDRLGQLVTDLEQPVHRPVTGVVADLVQPVDMDVAADPFRGSQFRRRSQSPVGDQREQHPLHR
jgi:hypothetical protein